MRRPLMGLALAAAVVCSPLRAQEAAPTVNADGGIHAANVTLPYSPAASPEARAFFPKMLAAGSKAPPITAPIEQSRAFYDRMNSDRAHRMMAIYPVKTHRETIAGVATDVVEPAQGIAPENKDRVLINLHGGAFLWGAHSGGLVESIPIASLGRIKVISVDYRQGPEHVFPAASEDVEAVYRALLKQYPPAAIGIYGCSAGGVLTGEAVARLIDRKLPVPGAIGTFCGSLVDMDGDSAYVAPLLNGGPVPAHPLTLGDLPYFKGASATDPLVFPGLSPALLAQFPPTLLITGTRDMAMSSVIRSQTLLSQAGVATELHVWEGMWHSFFSDPEMPESKAAYATIVRFFDQHLARK
ncbi:Acetyl esterase/lipase [Dyella jiangningensis]|uniref:alpha/beta hydrolase n=1 Tax=Dyella sp. AtDHG13 TaxID=1938897 RepID=UPI0008882E6D|nr:alpha/beta hydrolase fold domain-containing protein [Dyella sp. AtDHG13]PXV59921.1 acetyl esterase/lipase [Dyella sp. AtDHG13]SDJ17640.1 Acetyl esterase/lipase [Dyella jiangningensis]